ncbi:MAG TPA: glycosyltransferase family 8 protein [Flavipsychrobacter sp.]|nr:glycosyltransferase family 8 protein [Flavipsychrobacter sp.]
MVQKKRLVLMTYHIATATYDSVYYIPMYVMLFSLFENNRDVHVKAHILYNTLSDKQKTDVEHLASNYGNDIHWIKMDDEATKGFYTSAYLNVATYYRIFAPQLINDETDRLLFIDADVIVNGSVSELFSLNIAGVPLCAVKEVTPYKTERLGIPEGGNYFNAGIILYNLNDWRNNNYFDKLLQNIKIKHSDYWLFDQDALNAMFYNVAFYLHPKWNHQNIFYSVSASYLERMYGYPATEVLNNPVVIHYNTQLKPWNYLSTHPLKHVFIKYLHQTPFKDFAEKGSLRLYFKKLRNRVKHKLVKLSIINK